MRLLNVYSLELCDFANRPRPPYVAASHRWLDDDDETTYDDVQQKKKLDSEGYQKVLEFCKYVRTRMSSVSWLWIDTCCIDRKSSAELSEAINSMFRWYNGSVCCLAYLADACSVEDFGRSVWFTRGWTLQELIVPKTVIFLNSAWTAFGYKGVHPTSNDRPLPDITQNVAAITGIPANVLYDFEKSKDLSVDERMSWMETRSTQRIEDMAYSLVGIFDVSMAMIYGEEGKAFSRLWREIRQQEDDAENGAYFRLQRNRRASVDYNMHVQVKGAVSSGQQDTRVLNARDPNTDMYMPMAAGPTERITDPALLRFGIKRNLLSAENVDTGRENDLYSPFRGRTHGFFRIGRVFSTLWAEPAIRRDNATIVTSVACRNNNGELIHYKVRRFVVIAEDNHHCSALSLLTYGGEGVAKAGVNKHEHAIIYTGQEPGPSCTDQEKPLRGEQGMQPQSIRVIPDDPEYTLPPRCRLNLGKVYKVEHTVKCRNVGVVMPQHMAILEAQLKLAQLKSVWSERQGGPTTRDSAKQILASTGFLR